MKWIDVPPVWLAGAVVLAWQQAARFPMGLHFGGAWADFVGGLLVGGGLLLLVIAVVQFRNHRTTVNPHGTPDALIQNGIYRYSRNPIYVGDALILLGVILWRDAVLALPLLPVFVWITERRFILPEEDRLRRLFRADYARYCQKTRRWV